MSFIDIFNNNISFENDENLEIFLNKFYGGKVPSYDEKNYDKGILRINLTKNETDIKKIKFEYRYTKDNSLVSDKETLERINNLKIPYVWDYVWISIYPDTAIQVIGIDKSNKKQYLYNKEHIAISKKNKFNNLSLLISLMGKLNNTINSHSKTNNYYDKKYILSTIIKIILLTGMRAGKEFHAKKSNTYGITSLRAKHVKVKNGQVIFNFKGKANIEHTHIINDPDIVNHITHLLKLCKDKDDKVFHYKKNGIIKKIDEFTLNNYLHKYIHKNIVIKDLRTYLVNYLLIQNLLKYTKPSTKSKDVKNIIKNSIKDTANFIQHTVSVSKSNYIDDRIINYYINNFNDFKNNKRVSDFLVDIIKKI